MQLIGVAREDDKEVKCHKSFELDADDPELFDKMRTFIHIFKTRIEKEKLME